MIADLNNISPEELAEIRRLPPSARESHLRGRLPLRSASYVPEFLAEVVDAGADPATWGRGKAIVPILSLRELLSATVVEILAPLGEPGDCGWFSFAAEYPDELSDPKMGAPVRLRRDVSYLWTPPRGVGVVLLDTIQVRPVIRIDVAVRRWMAYRMWLVAGSDPSRLDEYLDEMSADAHIARRALPKEIEAHGERGVPPGFRGPDAWYVEKLGG